MSCNSQSGSFVEQVAGPSGRDLQHLLPDWELLKHAQHVQRSLLGPVWLCLTCHRGCRPCQAAWWQFELLASIVHSSLFSPRGE